MAMPHDQNVTALRNEKVGIVGSGLIGRSWAMLFAAAGFNVKLYDIEPTQVSAALDGILVQLNKLKELDLLRGTLSVEQQHSLVSGTTNLEECLEGAVHVQECVPEDHGLKCSVWKKIDDLVGETTVLASSASTMPISTLTSDLRHRSQTIIAHPTNPPLFLPLVEVGPADYTDTAITERTMSTMRLLGQQPVLIKKECPGFILNRMQYALLTECWRLVGEGIASPEDIDKVMVHGLGMRYAFLGPFDVTHLNAPEGFDDYCQRYGETIHRVVSQNTQDIPKWEGPSKEVISKSMYGQVPAAKIKEKCQWRDDQLAALAKLKKNSH